MASRKLATAASTSKQRASARTSGKGKKDWPLIERLKAKTATESQIRTKVDRREMRKPPLTRSSQIAAKLGEYPISPLEGTFIMNFSMLQLKAYAIAKSKGWWDSPRRDGELIALVHSELSEGLEGLRHGNPPSEHIAPFNAIEEEYADVIIRIMDHAQHNGWRVGEAVVAKLRFNEGRPHKHGGKKF